MLLASTPLPSPVRLSGRMLRGVAILLGLVTLAWPLLLWGDVDHFRENGPVEGPQSVYLGLATLLFLQQMAHPRPLTGLELGGIALFCFNLLVRETDVRGTWADHALGPVFAYGRLFWFIAGLWVAVVGLTLPRFRQTMLDLLGWLRTPAGIALVVGMAFYTLGDRAEKHWFFRDDAGAESLEETLELYGCYAIFLSACLTVRGCRGTGQAART